MFVSVVHLGQHAVMVDLDLGLRHGCHHSLLDIRVAKAGGGGLRRCEDQVDTISLDTEAQQSLHSGEDIDAVSVDNGIIWSNTRKKPLGECFYLIYKLSECRQRH